MTKYIGQTSRYLKTQVAGHQRSIKPRNLIKPNKTAPENIGKYMNKFKFEDTDNLNKQNKIETFFSWT